MFKVLGQTNIDSISSELSKLTLEDWNKWKDLQDLYKSHDSTLSYGLFFARPDQSDHYKVLQLDNTSGLAESCKPLIAKLTSAFKTEPIAAVFSLLKERRVIPIHIDNEYEGIHRIHIPIITNRFVYMFGNDLQLHNWKAGYIYDLNATKPHGIVNGSRSSRVHLVVDFPSTEFVKEIRYEASGVTF